MINTDFKDRDSILSDGVYLGTMNYKPIGSYLYLLVFSLFLLYIDSVYSRMIGIVLLMFIIVVFIYTKDKKIIDFYSDGLIIYHPDNENKAYYLDNNDIKAWSIDGTNKMINIMLIDNRQLSIETLRYFKAYNLFNKSLKDKKVKSKIEEIRKKKEEEKDEKKTSV